MRNIENTIKRYDQQFGNRNDNKGAFFMSDFNQIMQKYGFRSILPCKEIYNIVFDSLNAGFMIGYDCRKREESKARREHRQSMTPERLAMIENITRGLKDIPDHRLKALECWVAQYQE